MAVHERAQDVFDALQKKPGMRVDQLAQRLDLDEAEVAAILDEHLVEGGTLKHVGPGGGGGWVTPAAPEG